MALAYFLGSDYCEGVTGVGIVNAVEIIHAFPMHAKAKIADDENDDVPQSASGLKGASSAASAEAAGPLTGLRKFKDWLHGFDLEQELRFNAKPSADTRSHADDEALVKFMCSFLLCLKSYFFELTCFCVSLLLRLVCRSLLPRSTGTDEVGGRCRDPSLTPSWLEPIFIRKRIAAPTASPGPCLTPIAFALSAGSDWAGRSHR